MLETGSAFLSYAFPVAVKVTVLLGGVSLLLLAARRASAAHRHALAAVGLGASLLLPVLALVVPRWEVALLPSRSVTSENAAPAPVIAGPVASARGESSLATEAPGPVAGPTEPRVAKIGTEAPASQAVPAPPAAAPAPAGRRFPWGLLAFLAWALGAELALLRLVAGAGGASALSERARAVRDASWRALGAELGARLGLQRAVPLRRGDVPVAMTTGVVSPVVLLPEESEAWTDERRRVVLLHELAHVRRRDCLVQLVGELAVAVFWFHPLAWYLVRRLRDLAEDAADDLVLAAGERPSAYAGQLLEIVRELPAGAREPLPALAMGRPSGLESRLRAILDPARRRLGLSSGQVRGAAVVLLGAAALLAAVSPVERRAEAAATSPSAPRFDLASVAELAELAERVEPAGIAATPRPDPVPAARAVWTVDRATPRPVAFAGRRSRDGRDWYSRGMELHDDERYEDAIEAFKKAIEDGSREEAASYNIACGYARLGKKDEAFEWLKKARAAGFDLESYLDDDDDLRSLRSDPRWKALKETVRTSRSARWEAKARAAVERLDSLLAEQPRGARLDRVGRELLSAHEYDAAARALLAAAELGYREGTTYYNAACALSLKGDSRGALDALRRAVENGYDDPHHMREDDDLDPIREEKGYREIERLAEDLAQPGDGLSWSRHLFPTTFRAHWRHAAETAREVADRYPTIGRAWSNLGYAELKADRPAEARAAWQKALSLGYRKGATSYNIACAHARAGEKDQAFEWLAKAAATGFDIGSYLRDDDDLDGLRSDSRYRELTRKYGRDSRDDD